MTTEQFIEAIHGNGDGHFVIFEKPNAWSKFFTDSAAAAKYALERSDADANVYVGVGQMAVPPDKGRGTLEHITGLVGLWADIDIAGPTHDKKSLPPSEPEAMRILQRLGPPPTLLVRSGTGLHAWWLFKEAWTFESDEDKAKAIRLARRFNDTLRAVAQGLGYDADSVKDLTRVLRVVGTKHQTAGNVVEVAQNNGVRYEPDDFEQYLMAEEYSGERPTGVVAIAAIEIRPNTGLMPNFIPQLCENDTRFRRIWDRTARDMPDQSGSSYDLALANMLVAREYSDQEVADAIVAWRTKHGEKPEKALRRDYLSRTIGKAKAGQQSATAVTRLVAELPANTELTDAQKAECLDRLSELFKRRVVAFERFRGEQTTYAFRFADPDATVNIGTAAAIRGYEAVCNMLFDQGVIMDRAHKKRWDEVGRILLQICTDVEDTENTVEGKLHIWLVHYMEEHATLSGDNWWGALSKNLPCVRDNCLYIHASSLSLHIKRVMCDKPAMSITRYLRASGWEPEHLHHRDGETVTSKRYWRKPLDDVSSEVTTRGVDRVF